MSIAGMRIESAERSNELLLGNGTPPPGFQERPIGQAQAYTFGYDREIGRFSHAAAALGVQITAYGVPDALRAAYGSDPGGAAMFLRVRPRTAADR